MDAEGLINLSQAVAHGSLRLVKNYKTEQQGVVVNVMEEGFKVSLGADIAIWDYRDCVDITRQ